MIKKALRIVSAAGLLLAASFVAAAQCPSGGTTYTSGQGIGTLTGATQPNSLNPANVTANPYPSNLTVSSATAGTVTGVCVTINGLNADGRQGVSTQGLSIALKSPSGRVMGIVGGTSDNAETLQNVTLNITDSASAYIPSQEQNQPWPNTNAVTTGTLTYKPSTFKGGFNDTSFPVLGTLTAAQLANDQGAATLNGVFLGDTPAGNWQLYVFDSSGFNSDAISFSSWSLTLTVSQTNVSTSTTLSSNVNPSFTSGANSLVTLQADVTAPSGTPTGTVKFLDGNNAISGCAAVALSNGIAICTTAFSTEGTHAITAAYSASGAFTPSSTNTPLYQYVRNHSISPSSGLYCNPGTISMTGLANGTGTVEYPSVINVGTDTTSLSAGVSTVQVLFKGLSVSGGVGAGYIHALLQSPDGNHTLEFMSGAGDYESQSSVNLTWADAGATAPNSFSNVPLSSATYEPISEDNSNVFAQTPGGVVPSVPATFNFASPGGGADSRNFEEAFNGAAANGDWKLFMIENGGTNTAATLSGGWCIQITAASGAPTTTVLTASPNPAIGVPATITATVRNANTQALVTEGTVTFTENGQPVAGGPAAAVPVVNGAATFTTSSLPQGDHTITATYEDAAGTFSLSFGTVDQRVDNATPPPTTTVSGNNTIYTYCNTGSIAIPGPNNPTDKGPSYPYPSNIFVSALPGTTQDVSVTLNTFSHFDPQLVTSLLVGPGPNNLDFFSGAGGEPGTAVPVTLTFSDAAATLAPTSIFTSGAHTYRPTSYNGNDVFPAPAPAAIQYAGPIGTHTLDGTFAQANANENGTWSLFFNQSAGAPAGSVSGGWCLNFTQQLPVVTIAKTAVTTGNLTQGQTNVTYNISVGNSGPGATAGQVTVTDNPSSGLTITSMTGNGWTCSAATCRRSDSLPASSSYPLITVVASVATSATSPQTNTATVTAAAKNGGATSNTVSSTVLQSTTIAAADASVPFSNSAQNVSLSAIVTSGVGAVNTGTVTFNVVGMAGAVAVTSGAVTNGVASATFLVPAGTAPSSYAISATYNPGAAYSGSTDTTHHLTVQAQPPTVVSFNVDFGSQTYNLSGSRTAHLPWTITGITVVFSTPITTANVNSIAGVTATGLSGLGTTTLRWAIAPVTNATLAVKLAGSGQNAVADAGGNTLGGAGFTQAFSVLYGDFNGDGAVSAADMVLVNSARMAAYNVFADVNGDGVVNTADVAVVKTVVGATQQ